MIAIKQTVAPIQYARFVGRNRDEGREGIVLKCPHCDELYAVYYVPQMSRADAEASFRENVTREHGLNPPHHRDGFSLNEPFPQPEKRYRIEYETPYLEKSPSGKTSDLWVTEVVAVDELGHRQNIGEGANEDMRTSHEMARAIAEEWLKRNSSS